MKSGHLRTPHNKGIGHFVKVVGQNDNGQEWHWGQQVLGKNGRGTKITTHKISYL